MEQMNSANEQNLSFISIDSAIVGSSINTPHSQWMEKDRLLDSPVVRVDISQNRSVSPSQNEQDVKTVTKLKGSSSEEDSNDSTKQKHPFKTCLILAMPWMAYSVLMAVMQDVRVSYMTAMGISDWTPRFVPPLVAFFLGPVLGAASDQSLSRWGRRNVYLGWAALIVTVSGLFYGSASVLFPHVHFLTNLLFFLLVLGCLLFEVALRARIMDIVPLEYQVHAQAAFSLWGGFGGVIGMLLFRKTTSMVVFADDVSGDEILVSFGAAMATILITTTLSIRLLPEHPQERPAYQPPLGRLVGDLWENIVYAPMLFRILCVIQFVLMYVRISKRHKSLLY